jgi:hypothetical protein
MEGCLIFGYLFALMLSLNILPARYWWVVLETAAEKALIYFVYASKEDERLSIDPAFSIAATLCPPSQIGTQDRTPRPKIETVERQIRRRLPELFPPSTCVRYQQI